jgi:ankyrin repeat protein
MANAKSVESSLMGSVQQLLILQCQLVKASETGDVDEVRRLHTVAGANLEYDSHEEDMDSDYSKPIHYASFHGHLEVVQYLHSAEASLECKNSEGDTPYHLASRHGHISIVKFLDSVGASRLALNKDRRTPFHLAGMAGHVEISAFLESVGGATAYLPPERRQWTDLDENDEGTERAFCVGDEVLARFKGGERWYSGTVTNVNDDESYDIKYDDGYEEACVKKEWVTCSEE